MSIEVTTVEPAKATGGGCAMCGCHCPGMLFCLLMRPAFPTTPRHLPEEAAALAAWLDRVPESVSVCIACLRKHVPNGILAQSDGRIRIQGVAQIYFRLFGYPASQNRLMRRATKRAPLPATRSEAPPSTKRGQSPGALRRWFKQQRALRRRRRLKIFGRYAAIVRGRLVVGRRRLVAAEWS